MTPGDGYHLTYQGLVQWFDEVVAPWAVGVAEKMRKKKIVFVTDSTFQA